MSIYFVKQTNISINFIMDIYIYLFLAIAAWLNMACVGAYKDSPYEGFYIDRFLRELVISIIISLMLYKSKYVDDLSPLIVFIILIGINRGITECYKLFFREQDQTIYKIPTEMHFFGKTATSMQKYAILMVMIIGIVGTYFLLAYLDNKTEMMGILIGVMSGLLTAFGGGYKDAFFEGFEPMKFPRSPIISGIGGYFIYNLTDKNVLLTMVASIGFERVFVELYKGFLKEKCPTNEEIDRRLCYCPGKFNDDVCKYPEYEEMLEKRETFKILYFVSFLMLIAIYFYR